MPVEKDVNEKETYWCPKWYWPFAVCTGTVRKHKWCYNFAWHKQTIYGLVAYHEGCEMGTLFTWYEAGFGLGQFTEVPGEMCFDSPRSNSGKCDSSNTGLAAQPLVVDTRGRYAAVWELSDGRAWEARHGLSASQYQQAFDELLARGYRPTCVSGYVLGGEGRYAAVWEKVRGPAWEARHGLTPAEYQQTFDQLLARGYRPTCVSGSVLNGAARYTALWEKSDGRAWEARHGLTSSQYQHTFDELMSRGFRPTCVSGYALDGQDHYAALWEQTDGRAWEARHGLTAGEYQETFDALLARGYRLTCVSGYAVHGQDRYAAIWEKSDGRDWQARHGLDSAQYQQTFDALLARGYRLTWVSGYE